MKRKREAFGKVLFKLSWFLLISGLNLILACRSWSQIRVSGLGRDTLCVSLDSGRLYVLHVCVFVLGPVYYSQNPQVQNLIKTTLKLGPTALFTHLKIILLQYFQLSIFNNKWYPNRPIVQFIANLIMTLVCIKLIAPFQIAFN